MMGPTAADGSPLRAGRRNIITATTVVKEAQGTLLPLTIAGLTRRITGRGHGIIRHGMTPITTTGL